MCASYTGCRDCPLYIDNEQCTEIPSCFTKEFTDKVIKIVEKWSAAHPRKTRQSVFLEQCPEARLDDNECVYICPADVSANYRDESGGCAVVGVLCPDCRREFWMQEVE